MPAVPRTAFTVWITLAPGGGFAAAKLSFLHSRWKKLLQLKGHVPEDPPRFPQRHPQLTHSASGVSAQAVHSLVHSLIGRASAFAENCQNHSVKLCLTGLACTRRPRSVQPSARPGVRPDGKGGGAW